MEAFREFLFNQENYFNVWGFPTEIREAALNHDWEAVGKFIFNPATYFTWGPPKQMTDAAGDVVTFLSNPNEGNLNHLALELSAKNPISRFYMSMMYLSKINGLTKLYYPDGSLLDSIDFDRINNLNAFIYHNA